MPTTRQRYQVTETPEVGRALDLAAAKWPGESRSKLLGHLIQAGADALAWDSSVDAEAHRQAVIASSGRYPDAFGPNYLDDLRTDWPA